VGITCPLRHVLLGVSFLGTAFRSSVAVPVFCRLQSVSFNSQAFSSLVLSLLSFDVDAVWGFSLQRRCGVKFVLSACLPLLNSLLFVKVDSQQFPPRNRGLCLLLLPYRPGFLMCHPVASEVYAHV